MRVLLLASGLLVSTLSATTRADFFAERAFALGSRSSTNYNTPLDPPFDLGPTFSLLPPGTLPVSLDPRGSGNFADSALKFALGSIVPGGQSIISATLTFHVALSLTTLTGRDPSLTVSGFASDANSVSLADFHLKSTTIGVLAVRGNAGSDLSKPLPPLTFDVTPFLRSLEATGATSAGFRLDNLIGGTIILAGNDAINPSDRPSLSIVYAANVPEPASVVMTTLGLMIALVARRRSWAIIASV